MKKGNDLIVTVGQGRGSVEELYLGDELRDQGGRDERHGELETVYHGKEELAGERELHTMGGDAILTSCKISGTRGNLVQGSFSFKGTGELA